MNLFLAAFCPSTRTHGPGERAVVWVQGCPFQCPGCIAEAWQPMWGGKTVPVKELAEHIAGLNVDGLTISGGEPFLQAEELAELARRVRALRPGMTVITFTGYPFRQVAGSDLVAASDVVIDGQYDKRLDNGIGLRGSTNQGIHYLTDRLKGYDLATWERTTEWHMQPNGEVLIVGIPTEASRMLEYEYFGEEVLYERA